MDSVHFRSSTGAAYSQRRLKPFIRACTLAFVVVILAACGEPRNAGGPPGYGEMPPMPVTVDIVSPQSIEIIREYPGRVRGSREVEIRARVGGILEQRLYTEGQTVAMGEVLFRIERAPYEIILRQAEADVANAQAVLRQADREWRRISGLFADNVVSARDRDAALSARELAEARLQLAEAGLEEARLNLEYTDVRAPISGITGLELLSGGSLVQAGTMLTTILQEDPVHVRFSLPESDAVMRRTAIAGEAQAKGSHPVKLAAESELTGVVDFTDSMIDDRTGTVNARAVFPNPDGILLPGQFVRVRVSLLQMDNVFLVDPRAVGQGRLGPRVFVVSDAGIAHERTVTLGPVAENKQVIVDGLASGERVVVNGNVALWDGMKVIPDEIGGGEE